METAFRIAARGLFEAVDRRPGSADVAEKYTPLRVFRVFGILSDGDDSTAAIFEKKSNAGLFNKPLILMEL